CEVPWARAVVVRTHLVWPAGVASGWPPTAAVIPSTAYVPTHWIGSLHVTSTRGVVPADGAFAAALWSEGAVVSLTVNPSVSGVVMIAPLQGAMFETTIECPDGLAIGPTRKTDTWLVETIVTLEMNVPGPAPSML